MKSSNLQLLSVLTILMINELGAEVGGPLLTFDTGALKPPDIFMPKNEKDSNSQHIPKFLAVPPPLLYVSKTRPAVINCVAQPATYMNIVCVITDNKLKTSYTTDQDRYSINMTIPEAVVEEWFGAEPFTCYCEAWNTNSGKPRAVVSDSIIIKSAYLEKRFQREPISTNVLKGKQKELGCLPPKGKPPPSVHWLKNGVKIHAGRDPNYIITGEGSLIISQARLSDKANYSCVAESILGIKRVSDPAHVNVYVNGGWSPFSLWSSCPRECSAGVTCSSRCQTTSKQRKRSCDNPAPINGGAQCQGSHKEVKLCSTECILHGGWSEWSAWSTCSFRCTQTRTRTCNNPSPLNGGNNCGLDSVQQRNCSEHPCSGGNKLAEDSSSSTRELFRNFVIYGGVFLIVIVLLSVVFIIIYFIKRRSIYEQNMSRFHYQINAGSYNGIKGDDSSTKTRELLLPPDLTNSQLSKSMSTCFHDTASPTPTSGFTKFLPLSLSAHPIAPNHNNYLFQPLSQQNLNNNSSKCSSDNIVRNTNGSLFPSSLPSLIPPPSFPPPPAPVTTSSIDSAPISTVQSSSNNELSPNHYYQHPYHVSTANNVMPSPNKRTAPVPNIASLAGYLSSNIPTHVMNVPPPMTGISSSRAPTTSGPGSVFSGSSCAGQGSEIANNLCAWGKITNFGGRLSLPDHGISLTIPPGAVPLGYAEDIFLALDTNENDLPQLKDGQTLLSSMVVCGPPTIRLLKPIIISFPHCAALTIAPWSLLMLATEPSLPDQECTDWEEFVVAGKENSSTPGYCHFDAENCFLLTKELHSFCLIGSTPPEAGGAKAHKSLRLAVFAQPINNAGQDFQMRVYVMNDTKDVFETVLSLEIQNGARLIESPKQLAFKDGGENLCFSVEELSIGWKNRVSKFQEVKFSQLWSSCQAYLHVTISLEHCELNRNELFCKILAYQNSSYSNRQLLRIMCNVNQLTGVDDKRSSWPPNKPQGSMIPPQHVFRLSPEVRRELVTLMDKPCPTGNDWRMMAMHLGIDRYITYFASQSSPTEAILDLWEARHRDESALSELGSILRAIGRNDAASRLDMV